MQTHKNPDLRASSVVKDGDIKKPKTTKPAATVAAVKKPPRCELANNKWSVVSYAIFNILKIATIIMIRNSCMLIIFFFRNIMKMIMQLI